MSLYGSIRLAANSLRANQIALQVIGQNIANAQTPGYIREELLLSPAPTQRYGGLLLGLGVQVKGVIQRIDHFLEHRLRMAVSDRASGELQEYALVQLEGLLNELGDTDLSTALTRFFSSISEILNQPESISVRNLAVLQGETLSLHIRRLADRVEELRSHLNERVIALADDINRLTERIRTLNIQIAEMEGGDASSSDAVGLRDQRLIALEELAQIIDIRVEEQLSGGVTVYCGGLFLVSEGVQRPVEVRFQSSGGSALAFIHLQETDSPLETTAGQLAGLLKARDEILGGFLENLNQFARTLIFEFNRQYSQGQGLQGYSSLISSNPVRSVQTRLDQAGLPFPVQNGSFRVMVHHPATGQTRTTVIPVRLLPGAGATTLEGLAQELDAIDGIAARVTLDGRLEIRSESPDLVFAFAEDSSGVLASLGLNTFFQGDSASNIAVSPVVKSSPATFASSLGGIGADTELAARLAALFETPLPDQGSASLAVLYDRLVGQVAENSSVARAMAEAARVFEQTLRSQKLAISGVNLDEEAVRLIAFQRAFQASARYIGTLAELFNLLVNL